MEDEDPDSDDLFFTSTLLIIDPVNGSDTICSGTAASGTVFQGNTTVVLSGECFNEEVIHRDSMFTPQVSHTLTSHYSKHCRHTRPSY